MRFTTVCLHLVLLVVGVVNAVASDYSHLKPGAVNKAEADMFGWQWLGTACNENDILDACYAFLDLYFVRFNASGIEYSSIHDVWCNAVVTVRHETPQDAVARSKMDRTFIFTTQATHGGTAVKNNKTTSRYGTQMCQSLDPALLDQMGLSSTPIAALCELGRQGSETDPGLQPPPPPNPPGVLPDYVSTELKQWQSLLYAWTQILMFNEKRSIKLYCDNFAEIQPALITMGLNPHDIQPTVCEYANGTLPDVGYTVRSMRQYMSDIFASQLLHASHADGYAEFVCKAMQPKQLEAMSLDPDSVIERLCYAPPK